MMKWTEFLRRGAAGLATALLFAWTSCAMAAEPGNSIVGLNASRNEAGQTLLRVSLAKPMENAPAAFTINKPPRIAFDFPDTANGVGRPTQNFSDGVLRSVNIIQSGNRTRLVLNLQQVLAYDARIEGNEVLITLQEKPAINAVRPVASRFAESREDARPHEVRNVDFRRGKNGEGYIQVELSDPNIGIDMRQQGTRLIVDFFKTGISKSLQRKLDVVDFATPVQTIDTFVEGEVVRMIIEPKGAWEHSAYQTDAKFILEIKPAATDNDKSARGQSAYAGDKLTLNFQKIDVREALNVIADFTGLNMVISDSVSGNLTLRLKEVPWDQALDIILQSRGLDMRKNGNVIQVAPRGELAEKEKNDLAARQEISDLEELRTESFQLSYQKGEAMAAILANDKQRILSKRGSAVVDPRTNTLFIQDTPTHLEEARKLIQQIDVPVRQVMIEARIVEASDKFGRNLGVKLGYTSTPATPTATTAGTNVLGIRGMANGTANANNVNLPVANPAGTFSMILFNAAATKLLSLELTALETDSKGKIISSPRVVTADKVEATIEQGTEVPYQQASSSGATTTAFKKATLSLKVKPQITPDDNVMMDVNVTKDSVGAATYNGVPTIDTNKVNTQVLVENGGTVVIGGVYAQTDSTAVNKVPVLGDVPVLGGLFRSTTRVDNKSELLIFISPKIMKDGLGLR